MSKRLKLFLGISYILILFLFLYLIFSYIEITRLNDFLYYKDLQSRLENIIGQNLFFNLLIFFLFSIIWVSLLGFGSPLLIVSGILFGKWVGSIVSVISISVGALILYSIANFFFNDLVKNLLNKKFTKYIDLFKKNEFYYFLIFRFTGGLGIPFGIQNLLPIIFDMKKSNYFFASLLGLMPTFFIMNTIGSGLNDYIKQADSFSVISLILNKEIYIPIFFFFLIIIISTFVKKRVFDIKD